MKRIVVIVLCLLATQLWSQQWEIAYYVPEGVILTGGCCNGWGNYVFGAFDKLPDDGYRGAFAMFVDNEGNYLERKFVCEEHKMSFCQSISLNNGNAFVAGVRGGSSDNHVFDTLWIAVITPDLTIVEENFIRIEEPYNTWTGEVYLDYDDNGDIVLLAGASQFTIPYQMTNGVYAVIKCNSHTDLLASRYFSEGHSLNGARPTAIVNVPWNDNMMLVGKGFNLNGCHTLAYIDNDLELKEVYSLPILENNWNHVGWWKDNGNFLMSSLTHHYLMMENQFYAAVFEVDPTGHYIDTLVYDRVDTSDYTAQYGSICSVSNDAIYVATYWENGNNDDPNNVVVCMIDDDLNLLGTKRLDYYETKVRVLQCQVTSDGGCVVYGKAVSKGAYEMVVIWKLLPEDFILPWFITENSDELLKDLVYPNPASDCLNFTIEDVGNKVEIVIRDIYGRILFKQKLYDCRGVFTIDISSFETGTYLYEIVYDGKSTNNGKFIKN